MTDSQGALPAAARVGRASLVVNDLDTVTAFYRDVVGLSVRHRGDATATLGAGGDPLLDLTEDPDAPPRPARSAGLFHTAFRVPSRAALADALDRVRGAWELTGASDHHVSEALYLDDPEGNGVEVYRDRPRAEWPTDGAGGVEMDTLPLDLDALAVEGRGEASAPPGTDVGHVHLEVADLSAARRFYAGALGMNVRQEWGPSALFLAAGDYHHHVGLNTWNRRSEPRAGRGLDRFELVVPDAESLAAARERFAGAGVDVAPVEGGAADEGVEVRDPDGIAVRLRAGAE
jgi:catechol 2,3-dioxygenase